MPTNNNLFASSMSDYLPNKVLGGFAHTLEPLESWMYDDGTGDPWWQGASGLPYKWKVTLDVTTQQHSSHLSRLPFFYTGLDVVPGMWIFSTSSAMAVRIVSVLAASDSSVTVIVEDVDRHNTFRNPNASGDGVFSVPNDVVLFELGEDGLPIIDPLPSVVNDLSILSQVEARFRVFNETVKLKFFQLNHGFTEGNILTLNAQTGLFQHANANDIYMVGTVTSVGPGPNQFYLSPSTKFIRNLEPGLPGSRGDVIWLHPATGEFTTAPLGSNVPVFIQMTDAVPCFSIGSVDNPTTWNGTVVKINNVPVEITGTDPIQSQVIVDAINDKTLYHSVFASMSSAPTVVTGNQIPDAFPEGPDYLMFEVNGVLTSISPPSINYGTSGQIGWWDVVRAVNEQSSRHGVYATWDQFTGYVTFTKASGGDITFTNINPTVSNGANKTFTDLVGVVSPTQASSPTRIKLERPDGGRILLQSIGVGDLLADCGLTSSANGELPLALVVDKSMSASKSYVVATMADRDLVPNVRSGDQVFVQNSGNGEWALFVKTDSTWTLIADQDSANTDANTLTATINFDSTSPFTIGAISDQSRVVNVTVVVEDAFDSINSTLSIGDELVSDSVMRASGIDLTSQGTYETTSEYENTSGSDVTIQAFLSNGGATKGRAKIMVSYL